ncbi:lipid A biosynthesis lauroyl acyltransferase [Bauldia sp.]|uniref:lipid A biosynthesis lauroyl acyltransferase n=1 Tax=Bauldia sp. TaxID=2575872 RepID=UPI003BAC1E2D
MNERSPDDPTEAGDRAAKKLKREARRRAREARKRRRKEARKAARKAEKQRRRQSGFGRITNSDFLKRRVAGLVRFIFKWDRAMGRERASAIAAGVAPTVGRLSRENRVAAANLAAAYPDKSEAERAKMLTAVWGNLARQTMEYPFLQDLADAFDPSNPHDGVVMVDGLDHAYALRDGGRAGIIFGAHLGNWELVAAVGARIGLTLTALYRPPANPYVAEEIERLRDGFYDQMVVSGRGAALKIASTLARGRHVGVVIDQRIGAGQLIPFFGRPSLSNPVIGWLARRYECPVHGAYAIRLPDGRFRITMTPALDLPRDADGKIDAEEANIVVHGMVEQWIRENPEQWLWLHDRWRYGRRRDKRQY